MKKGTILTILIFLVALAGWLIFNNDSFIKKAPKTEATNADEWMAPDINALHGDSAELIKYGKDLIAKTAVYLGPRGTVARLSNGLNCQNCHLDAGTRLNSNCLAAVASTYPKVRNRSGKLENVEFRINECMERSMNGTRLDSNSREMKAMKAYMLWLGTGYQPKKDLDITGTGPLPYLPRAADPAAGERIFGSRCASCHGMNGMGVLAADSASYVYPPLWGYDSYNIGAGMYTLSKLAGFIKYNMPFSATPLQPQLTDEESWDLAAYINSQKRPEKIFAADWPDISKKPVDYPIGPYTDSFSARQHKFGPFEPIVKAGKPKK